MRTSIPASTDVKGFLYRDDNGTAYTWFGSDRWSETDTYVHIEDLDYGFDHGAFVRVEFDNYGGASSSLSIGQAMALARALTDAAKRATARNARYRAQAR